MAELSRIVHFDKPPNLSDEEFDALVQAWDAALAEAHVRDADDALAALEWLRREIIAMEISSPPDGAFEKAAASLVEGLRVFLERVKKATPVRQVTAAGPNVVAFPGRPSA